MPYVSRNEKGKIIELHNSPGEESEQWLEANNPEILDFLKCIETTEQAK